MNGKLGERRELARQVRKQLADYLYWLQACGRDEAKAHRVLLAAQAELGRLVGLDAAASGIGGEDTGGHLEIERLTGQLNEGAGLLSAASARIQAGTRTLNVLAALARSWEDQAARPAGPAAGVLRACAAQLRQAVAGTYAPVRPTAADPAGTQRPASRVRTATAPGER